MRQVNTVIEALECLAYMHECTYSENRCPYYMEEHGMCDNSAIAKDALKLLSNQPLTLDELKEMEGEPVWVEVLAHESFADPADDFDGWGLCRKSWVRIWDHKRGDLITIDYHFEDYNKEWRAYRQRKE